MLGNLTRLTILEISHNRLQSLPGMMFSHNSSIKVVYTLNEVVDLSYNRLEASECLEVFRECRALTCLDIRGNKMADLSVEKLTAYLSCSRQELVWLKVEQDSCNKAPLHDNRSELLLRMEFPNVQVTDLQVRQSSKIAPTQAYFSPVKRQNIEKTTPSTCSTLQKRLSKRIQLSRQSLAVPKNNSLFPTDSISGQNTRRASIFDSKSGTSLVMPLTRAERKLQCFLACSLIEKNAKKHQKPRDANLSQSQQSTYQMRLSSSILEPSDKLKERRHQRKISKHQHTDE